MNGNPSCPARPAQRAGRLAGRVALITGAAGGIGSATALMFSQEGARVALMDVDTDGLNALATRIAEEGGQALVIPGSVADESSVQHAVRRTEEYFGKLDSLFNTAGGSRPEDSSVVTMPLSVWHDTLQLDLLGSMLCCRHALPAMVRAGGGTVVNMSSGAALRGTFSGHAYTAAKGAIVSLTRALAGEYAAAGVRVNAICAGRIRTARILQNRDAGSALSAEFAARYPNREGDPIDIAHIAVFLTSNESRMITGEAIAANGGAASF